MAEEIIVLPPRDPAAFRMYFNSTFKSRVERNKMLFLSGWLLELRRRYPNDTPLQLKEKLHKHEAAWRRGTERGMTSTEGSVMDVINGTIQFVDIFSGLHKGVPIAVKAARALTDLTSKYYLAPKWEIAAREQQWAHGQHLDLHGTRILDALREHGIDDPVFRDTLMQYIPELGDPWKQDPAILMKSKPSVPRSVRRCVQPDGSIVISVAALREDATQYFAELKSQGEAALGMLGTVLIKQDELLAHAQEVRNRWADQEQKEREQQEARLLVEGISGGISIVSTLVGLTDKKLGREIAVVGEAAVQIGQGLVSLALSGGNPLAMLSAGSQILGAVMNIAGLSEEGPATPDQMILEELGVLQQHVSQLRDEIHERFDSIDRKLDKLFDLIAEGFSIIIGKVDGVLTDIEAQVGDTLAAMRRLDMNLGSFFQELAGMELRDAIEDALTWREVSHDPMPLDNFREAEMVLHRWATRECLNTIETGGTSRSYKPHEIEGELAKPLEANLRYLNGWLAQQKLPVMSSAPLPNLNTWAISAGAAANLRSDWIVHAASMPATAQRSADERAMGEQLRSAFASLTRGPRAGGVNRALWERLIKGYKDEVASLDTATLDEERAFLRDLNEESGYDRDRPQIDIFGSPSQTPVLPRPVVHRNDGLSLTVPPSVSNALLLAEYFKRAGTTDFGLEVDGEWTSEHRDESPGSRAWWATFTVAMTLSYRSTPVLSRTITTKPQKFDRVPDARSHLQTWWPKHFERSFAEGAGRDALSAEGVRRRDDLYATLEAELRARLDQLQKDSAAHVGRKLESDQTLLRLASTVNGAKALIRDFLLLGFPRAFEVDGYLRMFLDGEPALPDHDAYLNAFEAATEAAGPPERHPSARVRIREDADKRADALGATLGAYLDLIASGDHEEFHPRLEMILTWSEIASRMGSPDWVAAVPPLPPAKLVATPGAKGEVALEWRDNAESDLVGYRVYRKVGDGQWSPMAKVRNNRYVDAELTRNLDHRYRVTALDGSNPANESEPSETVAAEPPAGILSPSIRGVAVKGRALTAKPGRWSGMPPLDFTYEWRRAPAPGRSGVTIPGANGPRYVLTTADVGSFIRLVVTAGNPIGQAKRAVWTSVVGTVATRPSRTSQPGIAGVALAGKTLTAGPGGWSGTSPLSFAYQWRRVDGAGQGVDIPAATGQDYVVSGSDVGSRIQVAVTASNVAGSESALSARTEVVRAPIPSRVPVPWVRELSERAAAKQIVDAGLTPGAVGATGRPGAWVWDQSPDGGVVVDAGSTVIIELRSGPML